MQTANPEITRVLLQRCAELEQRTRMSDERWNAVDRYVTDLLVPPDAALDAALAATAAAGLPPHDVSPAQGRLLELLARLRGAGRILEIGTLGGYSTISLARGLRPGGAHGPAQAPARRADRHARALARACRGRARQPRARPARRPRGRARRTGARDVARPRRRRAVRPRLRRRGRAARGGVRAVGGALASAPGVCATTIQTVGVKGYDGFTLALVDG